MVKIKIRVRNLTTPLHIFPIVLGWFRILVPMCVDPAEAAGTVFLSELDDILASDRWTNNTSPASQATAHSNSDKRRTIQVILR